MKTQLVDRWSGSLEVGFNDFYFWDSNLPVPKENFLLRFKWYFSGYYSDRPGA